MVLMMFLDFLLKLGAQIIVLELLMRWFWVIGIIWLELMMVRLQGFMLMVLKLGIILVHLVKLMIKILN